MGSAAVEDVPSMFERLDMAITAGFEKIDGALKSGVVAGFSQVASPETVSYVKVITEVQMQQASVQEKQNAVQLPALNPGRENPAEKKASKYLDGSYIYSDYEDVFGDLNAV